MALGFDISGVEDVDSFLTLTDGPKSAAQAVMSSLLHSPGVLWWAPETGHDVRQYLNGAVIEERVQRAVTAQAELDERVDSAQCVVTRIGNEVTIDVALVLTEDDSAVEFTLTIDQLGAVLNASVA